MEIREAIIHALDGDAILFIGSGFSLGATNEKNDKFETATPLAHKLLKECEFEEKDFTNDLGIASRIYQDTKGEIDLVEFLRKEYTAIDVTSEQEIIAKINWQRIYTTNYDNVFELACEKTKKRIQSVILSDRPNDYKNKSNICIHINGDIKRLTQEKLNNEFKLTNISYLTEDFNKSEWSTLFRSDLLTAKSIFFIGYSMQYDLDLQRIVFSTPDLIAKTFFIIGEQASKSEQMLIKTFGQPFPIGIKNFTAQINDIKNDHIHITKIPDCYLCFNQPRIKESPTSILDNDEFNFLVYGEYDINKLYYSTINPKDFVYAICRSKHEEVLKLIKNGEQNILIHSDLGNGKSIFIATLIAFLSKAGYNVLKFNKYYTSYNREIEQICQKDGKYILVFDDYMSHIDCLKELKIHRTNQILILSERSAMNDIYYNDLCDLFGGFHNINLNRLDYNEIKQFVNILNHYGFWNKFSAERIDKKEDFIRTECKGQIKNIILRLLNSKNILDSFQKLIASIRTKKGYYEAILFILIARVSKLDLDLEDLAYSLNMSQLNSPSFQKDPFVREFVDFDTYTIKSKSSIISHVLLQQIFDSTIVVDVMLSIFRNLNEHRHNEKVRRILRNMMMFTNIQQALNKEDANYKYNILRYYENIKSLPSCDRNPHFWLQYAIVKLSEHDYEQAKIYFNAAYSFAKRIDNFDTYQIDNHYARFILENEIKLGTKETCMEAFLHAHSILMDPKHKIEVRYYPYRVAQNYYPFYERFYKLLNNHEQKIFIQSCCDILKRLKSYLRNTTTASERLDVKKAEQNLTRILKELNIHYKSEV